MTTPLLDAALRYAALGWPVLPTSCFQRDVDAGIPRTKAGKRPLIPGGLSSASRDERTIRDWWTRWPDANVAVRCDHLAVVDVDPRNGGNETMDALYAKHGVPEATYVVQTGGRGYHFYFARPQDEWSKLKIGPGVDLQRGEGAYVLAPPSVTSAAYESVMEPVPLVLRESAWLRAVLADLPSAARAPRAREPKPVEAEWGPARLRAHLERVVHSMKDGSRELVYLAIQGRPLAPMGERDDALLRLAGAVAHQAPLASVDAFVDLVDASLATYEADDHPLGYTQASRREWAAEKFQRALIDARAALRAPGEEPAFGRRQWDPPADADPSLAPSPQHVEAARLGRPGIEGVADARSGRYAPEEVRAFAQQQGCATYSEFRQRWIVEHAGTYRAYSGGDYLPAVGATSAAGVLDRELSPAWPWVETRYVESPEPLTPAQEAKGMKPKPPRVRQKTPDQLVRDYGVHALRHEGSLEAQHSVFDPRTRTFLEAVCPRRRITPARSADVQAWLEMVGGESREQLLDWVAALPRLEVLAPALYLRGPKSAGKTLFAKACARIWTTGSYSDFSDATGDFNDTLTRCPLLVADEQAAKKRNDGHKLTALVRRFTGSKSHPLKRKYESVTSVQGCLRVMFLANNDDVLSFDEEDPSRDDREAFRERVFYVAVGEEPGRFLATLDRDSWVSDDVVARHVLWLAQERRAAIDARIAGGARFAVDGNLPVWMVGTGGRNRGAVLEFVARYAVRGVQSDGHMLVGDDRILVHADAFRDHYGTVVTWAKDQLPTQVVTKELRHLSLTGEAVRVTGGKAYWDLDLDLVFSWAETNGVDVEELKRRVAGHRTGAKGGGKR